MLQWTPSEPPGIEFSACEGRSEHNTSLAPPALNKSADNAGVQESGLFVGAQEQTLSVEVCFG